MKRIRGASLAIALVMGLCVFLNYQYYVVPLRFLDGLVASAQVQRRAGSDSERIAQVYSFDMDLSKESIGELPIYAQRFEPMEEATAMRLMSVFGFLETEVIQTDGSFLGYGDGGMLAVHRYTRSLKYTPTIEARAALTRQGTISEREALEIAQAFINERGLYTPHYETDVRPSGSGGFVVYFINRINGIKNLGLVTSLSVSAVGQPLELVHTGASLDRLSTHPTISMYRAAKLLPADIDPALYPVRITSAELVYTLENSIIQPAYLFIGKKQTGEEFAHFVLASDF